jgi:hypothetical protein
MSRWIRGIYNAAANFNMSRSLRAAAGRTLDRNDKQLHIIANERDQHVESVKPCESAQSCQHGSTCHRNRNTACGAGNYCYTNACRHTTDNPIEREYNEYITATRNTKGQNTSSGLRNSIEFRYSQRSSNATETDIEYITGIPAGTTI